jgi:NTE family protein
VNTAVRQIPSDRLAASPIPLRDVGLALVTPSVPLEEIALAHGAELPSTIRTLLSAVGGMHRGGGTLLSYLLFAPGFCKALLELGRADAEAKRADIESILSGAPCAVLDSAQSLVTSTRQS